MTKFEIGLQKLETSKIEWCIGYLEKNGKDFPDREGVEKCITTMKKELENRK